MAQKSVFLGVPKGRVLTLEERKARGAIFCGPGLTEQSHKDSCDINKIMERYEVSGLVPVNSDQVPQFGDFSQVTDYQTALNLVIEAQESFDQLPAAVRKEFDHDPGLFLSALEDPQKRQRLVELGVFVEAKAQTGSEDKAPQPPSGGSGA